MTQKELNKLYEGFEEKFEDNFDDAVKGYWNKLEELGGDCISYDWKGGGEGADEFIEYLRKHKFIVLEDPQYEGSDTYGWVIFPPK